MALPTALDRVQVLKQETAALGGKAADEAPWPAPIKPEEDMVEAAGMAVQRQGARDENVGCYRRNSGDPATDDLALVPAFEIGQVYISTDGQELTLQQPLVSEDGWLINDNGELLVVG